ncbi:MAG TPA: pyridoxamine 5'-phosphate oxidase [Candidatus Kapabacteria bacterium]|jgi:pyridoxamine 5'-phosphate oxidase|nr:pyridoxamine 5'-phosphate oxidase [Candidatus Kapabacteria bacterium]HOV92889.1 pyridoxamine 5'-phosphate oxidase [Candidatus Kapabacteria bacterium]
MKFIEDQHRDYQKSKLDEQSLTAKPFELFTKWFELAKNANIVDPNAFILSTSTTDGKPSSRVVLLKSYDENGFVFFSNYQSRKAREIDENPNVAMLFFWDDLEKQIRIEGVVEKTSEQESYDYFKTRPYTSKLGSWASRQSQPLSNRFKLIREVAKLMAKYPNPNDVPLPPYWGGYRVHPFSFEFWQGRPSRLHDRFLYKLVDDDWKVQRLYP